MSASFYDLLKYAATGIASPDMTAYDKQKALAMCKAGFPVKTLTGVPPISFKSDGSALTEWSISGNMVQTGTPIPSAPIMPEFVGVKTANLWANRGFSAKPISSNYTHKISNDYGTTLSTTNGNEVTITQSEYPTGNVGYQNGFFMIDVDFSKYAVGSVVTISFDYIVNEIHAQSTINTTSVYAGSDSNTVSNTLSSGDWKISGRLTAKITVLSGMLPYVEVRLCGNSITVKNIMLNTGSTVLPYEPFGYKIQPTCAGQTVPVYLGQTQTVRRIKKVVLTGQETVESGSTTVYIQRSDMLAYAAVLCSHYQYFDGLISGAPDMSIATGSGAGTSLWFKDSRYGNDATDFKSYLAAQYAAGTPVTVWYVLATPTTGIVNEPLAKIGDYADELNSTDAAVTIPTAKGQNVLTVETELQPSEMSITGHIKSN